MGKTIISVVPLKQNSNTQQKSINKLLKEAGLRGWDCVQIASLYGVEGQLTEREIELSAHELFCDPVIEKFSVNSKPKRPGLFFSDIWFRKGVTEPAAETILKALQDLKIHSSLRAFSGTRYEFVYKPPHLNTLPQGERKKERVNLLKKQLREFVTLNLLNPLIQECRIIPPPDFDAPRQLRN